MENNIILDTDSYKYCHHSQYLPKTEIVYSYFEARNGATYNKTLFFGLQYLIKKYLLGQVITKDKIMEARELSIHHFGDASIFNENMWNHILTKHDGRLPIKIKAVPEGTCVDINNVMMTVENTDPLCFPLTNHLETMLSRLWAPSTTATLSYEIFLMIKHYLNQTSDDFSGIRFMLHDFGSRGVSSKESAAIQSAGHLLNFSGTDTIVAMQLLRNYYNAPYSGLAYSVPATEHSVMTSNGHKGEDIIFKQLLETYPTGILSVVIDSYDYRNFIDIYAYSNKEKILNRDGKVVFRPDSGDPNSVTIDVIERLANIFGYTKNSKGYKVLNLSVGVLWGDGIDYQGIRSILYTMKNQGWAASNIVFGCGGGLLQKINRDTQRFAFKCSAQKRDNEWIDIFKKPLDVSKTSKSGRLKLIKNDDIFETVKIDEPGEDLMETVFLNGELIKETNFAECRLNVGTW